MPSRIIREGWLESEAINSLDQGAELFFLRLCLRADDYGCYHANPVLLKSLLFPLREATRSTDIPRWLAACEKAGLVRCYSDHATGKSCLHIPKFGQRVKPGTKRKFGEVPDFSRKIPENPGRSEKIPPLSDCGLRMSESKSDSDARAAQAPPVVVVQIKELSAAETIYEAYPRKTAKPIALAAISKALTQDLRGLPYLLERTQSFATAISKWPPGNEKWIPMPSTWFNQQRYDDDPKTWERHDDNLNGKPNSRSFSGRNDYTGIG